MQSHATHRSHIIFFNDTATTEIYPLSLHDALPISADRIPDLRPNVREAFAGLARLVDGLRERHAQADPATVLEQIEHGGRVRLRDRKSTRLNSSHLVISYAVFCLKKKK